MNILYLTKGDHVDYQNDCLLIGLKETFGNTIVDYNKQEHNYDTYDPNEIGKFWGKGMTVTRVLPDLDVDRTDITNKIKNKFFDYIVYGSIWRCADYINDILKYYEPHKIIAVDGEDHTRLHNSFNWDVQYFKRELLYENPKINPISFAIPTSKINFVKDNKKKAFAFINPLNAQTYIYNNEADYYKDYQESCYGVTLKKAGWDCMRHYEIIANGCIPYFLNIEYCPPRILTQFPKDLCLEVSKQLQNKEQTQIVYNSFIEQFEKILFDKLTTKALAKYFINTITNATN